MRWFLAAVIAISSLNIIGCGQSKSGSAEDFINEKSGIVSIEDIDEQTAFLIAINDAGVPQDNVYDVEIEKNDDNPVPIYNIEFETNYGEYDYEIAVENGAVVGADYEVDKEWFEILGGNPVTMDEARRIVHEKVSNAPLDKIEIREKNSDGQKSYKGKVFFNDMKYEFEIDSTTGIIFDWDAEPIM